MVRVTTSEDRVLNRVTCLALHLLWVVAVSSIGVKVDYTIHVQRGGGAMPDDVNVTVSTGAKTMAILHLTRVPHINLDFPLYTLNHDGTGTMVRRRERRAIKMMTAFYQDMATDAVFQLTRNENSKKKKDSFKLKGEFQISGKSFFLNSEKRRKRHFQTTRSRSTSRPSSSPIFDSKDEIYSLKVQQVQRGLADDFMEAPPQAIVSMKPPRAFNAPNVSDRDSRGQETEDDTVSSSKPEADEVIDLSSYQPSIPLDSNGSSGEPDLFAQLKRRRRSTKPLAVDVAAVVDYSVYVKFLTAAGNDRTSALQNIREYFAFIFNGVDQIYQSINMNHVLNVYLSQVLVAESRSASPLANTNHFNSFLDSKEALYAFSSFVALRAKGVVTSCDHAMLFTAYDLTVGTDPSNVGYAYVSTLCKTDGSSVSVIEETNNYQSIIIAAHELAHSLSVKHDGDGNNCSPSERYIMAEVPSNAETALTVHDPWQFSPCSVASLTSYLNQLLATSRGVTCLTGHPPIDISIPDVSGRLLGQEIPPDQQCQAKYGPGSKVCGGHQKIGSHVCRSLYCFDTRDFGCYPNAALDGTTCGSRKICRSGKCVSDPQAPTADESCMFGDQPGVMGLGLTCPQFIQDFPGQCYDPGNQRVCCKTCRAAYRTVKGCEYGDRLKGCTSQHCSQHRDDCCGTCENGVPFTTKPMSVVTYAPRPSNKTPVITDDVCLNRELSCYFLEDDAVTQCYDEGFNRKCCQFCQRYLTKIPGCKYGDRRPEFCIHKSICTWNAFWCCQFCETPSDVTTGYSRLHVSSGDLAESSAVYVGKTSGQQIISLVLLVVCSMCFFY